MGGRPNTRSREGCWWIRVRVGSMLEGWRFHGGAVRLQTRWARLFVVGR